MAFADNLQQLPSVDHVAELQLRDAHGQLVTAIPNQPGKASARRLQRVAGIFDRHRLLSTYV